MARLSKVGTHATRIRSNEDVDGKYTEIDYHNTTVVTFYNKGKIILKTGGWKSQTTKTRMNQASNQFNLGYRVFQKDNAWYVEWEGKVLEFFEDIIILEPEK